MAVYHSYRFDVDVCFPHLNSYLLAPAGAPEVMICHYISSISSYFLFTLPMSQGHNSVSKSIQQCNSDLTETVSGQLMQRAKVTQQTNKRNTQTNNAMDGS